MTTHIALPEQHATLERDRSIVVRHRDGDEYEIGIRGHWLVTDQPVEAGGADRGPTPTEVFVASLAGCVAHYAGRFLDRHGLGRNGMTVSADFDLATDRPARVAAIRIAIGVHHALSGEEREALLAVASHCTVGNSLAVRPAVHIELTDVEPE